MYLNIIYEDGHKRLHNLSDDMTISEAEILVYVYRAIPGVKEVYINVKDINYRKSNNNEEINA